jgi:putative SOS response-associated peptidase YedK
MPVILSGLDRDHWLDERAAESGGPSIQELRAMVERASDHGLGIRSVSIRVNGSKHDDSSLLEPVEEPPDEPPGLFGRGD